MINYHQHVICKNSSEVNYSTINGRPQQKIISIC